MGLAPRVYCTLGNQSLVRSKAIVQEGLNRTLLSPLYPSLYTIKSYPITFRIFPRYTSFCIDIYYISSRLTIPSIHPLFVLSLIFVLLHLPCPQCSSSTITIHCSPSIQLFSPHYKQSKHHIDQKFRLFSSTFISLHINLARILHPPILVGQLHYLYSIICGYLYSYYPCSLFKSVF